MSWLYEMHTLSRRNDAGAVPLHIDRKSYHLSLDEVPVLMCNQCGEVYFDEA